MTEGDGVERAGVNDVVHIRKNLGKGNQEYVKTQSATIYPPNTSSISEKENVIYSSISKLMRGFGKA